MLAAVGAAALVACLVIVRSLSREADVTAAVVIPKGIVQRQLGAQPLTSASPDELLDAQPRTSEAPNTQLQSGALPDVRSQMSAEPGAQPGAQPMTGALLDEAAPATDASEIAHPLYDDPSIRKRWSSKRINKGSGKGKLLPILDYNRKSTDKVAITIDDCFQFDNLREMLDLADEYGAKLTFFPIGYQIPKKPEIWREIIDRGHEIQNHSYHHIAITTLSDRKLYLTITMHERALNKALGVNYRMKYFRPKGGTGRKTPRLSAILRDLGYQAIASWGLSGSQNIDKLIEKSSGGHIILFHTTDKDLEKFRKLLPALKEKGLKMVTINELYGRPGNEIVPLPPESA